MPKYTPINRNKFLKCCDLACPLRQKITKKKLNHIRDDNFKKSIHRDCKKPIPFYRNVPIISFIIQLGRCANCKQRISIQYPTVELINGLLWGWAFKNLLFPEAIAV